MKLFSDERSRLKILSIVESRNRDRESVLTDIFMYFMLNKNLTKENYEKLLILFIFFLSFCHFFQCRIRKKHR